MTQEINTVFTEEELKVFKYLGLKDDDLKRISKEHEEKQQLSDLQSTGFVVKSSGGVNWSVLGKYVLAGGATVVAGYILSLSFEYAIDSAVGANYKLDANIKFGSFNAGLKISPVK